MSSFNPNAPASNPDTGAQERRIKREKSAEDAEKLSSNAATTAYLDRCVKSELQFVS